MPSKQLASKVFELPLVNVRLQRLVEVAYHREYTRGRKFPSIAEAWSQATVNRACDILHELLKPYCNGDSDLLRLLIRFFDDNIKSNGYKQHLTTYKELLTQLFTIIISIQQLPQPQQATKYKAWIIDNIGVCIGGVMTKIQEVFDQQIFTIEKSIRAIPVQIEVEECKEEEDEVDGGVIECKEEEDVSSGVVECKVAEEVAPLVSSEEAVAAPTQRTLKLWLFNIRKTLLRSQAEDVIRGFHISEGDSVHVDLHFIRIAQQAGWQVTHSTLSINDVFAKSIFRNIDLGYLERWFKSCFILGYQARIFSELDTLLSQIQYVNNQEGRENLSETLHLLADLGVVNSTTMHDYIDYTAEGNCYLKFPVWESSIQDGIPTWKTLEEAIEAELEQLSREALIAVLREELSDELPEDIDLVTLDDTALDEFKERLCRKRLAAFSGESLDRTALITALREELSDELSEDADLDSLDDAALNPFREQLYLHRLKERLTPKLIALKELATAKLTAYCYQPTTQEARAGAGAAADSGAIVLADYTKTPTLTALLTEGDLSTYPVDELPIPQTVDEWETLLQSPFATAYLVSSGLLDTKTELIVENLAAALNSEVSLSQRSPLLETIQSQPLLYRMLSGSGVWRSCLKVIKEKVLKGLLYYRGLINFLLRIIDDKASVLVIPGYFSTFFTEETNRNWLFNPISQENHRQVRAILSAVPTTMLRDFIVAVSHDVAQVCLASLLSTSMGAEWLFSEEEADRLETIFNACLSDSSEHTQVISEGLYQGTPWLFWVLSTLVGEAWLFGGSDRANRILANATPAIVSHIITQGPFKGLSCLFFLLESERGRDWLASLDESIITEIFSPEIMNHIIPEDCQLPNVREILGIPYLDLLLRSTKWKDILSKLGVDKRNAIFTRLVSAPATAYMAVQGLLLNSYGINWLFAKLDSDPTVRKIDQLLSSLPEVNSLIFLALIHMDAVSTIAPEYLTFDMMNRIITQGTYRGAFCLFWLLRQRSGCAWLFANEERANTFLNNPEIIKKIIPETANYSGESCLFLLLRTHKGTEWLFANEERACSFLDDPAVVNSVSRSPDIPGDSALYWLLRSDKGREWLFANEERANAFLNNPAVINFFASRDNRGESCLYYLFYTDRGQSWLFGGGEQANIILSQMSTELVTIIITNTIDPTLKTILLHKFLNAEAAWNWLFADESRVTAVLDAFNHEQLVECIDHDCLSRILLTPIGRAWLFSGVRAAELVLNHMSLDTLKTAIASNPMVIGEACLRGLLHSNMMYNWLTEGQPKAEAILDNLPITIVRRFFTQESDEVGIYLYYLLSTEAGCNWLFSSPDRVNYFLANIDLAKINYLITKTDNSIPPKYYKGQSCLFWLLCTEKGIAWLFSGSDKANTILRTITPEIVNAVIEEGPYKGQSCLFYLLSTKEGRSWLFSECEEARSILSNISVGTINYTISEDSSCLFWLLNTTEGRDWLFGDSDNAKIILIGMSAELVRSIVAQLNNTAIEDFLFKLFNTQIGRDWLLVQNNVAKFFAGVLLNHEEDIVLQVINYVLDLDHGFIQNFLVAILNNKVIHEQLFFSAENVQTILINSGLIDELVSTSVSDSQDIPWLFWLLSAEQGLLWLFGGSDKANEILNKLSVDIVNHIISQGIYKGESCLFRLLSAEQGLLWLFGGSDKANEILSNLSVDTVCHIIPQGYYGEKSCLFLLLSTAEGRDWLFGGSDKANGILTAMSVDMMVGIDNINIEACLIDLSSTEHGCVWLGQKCFGGNKTNIEILLETIFKFDVLEKNIIVKLINQVITLNPDLAQICFFLSIRALNPDELFTEDEQGQSLLKKLMVSDIVNYPITEGMYKGESCLYWLLTMYEWRSWLFADKERANSILANIETIETVIDSHYFHHQSGLYLLLCYKEGLNWLFGESDQAKAALARISTELVINVVSNRTMFVARACLLKLLSTQTGRNWLFDKDHPRRVYAIFDFIRYPVVFDPIDEEGAYNEPILFWLLRTDEGRKLLNNNVSLRNLTIRSRAMTPEVMLKVIEEGPHKGEFCLFWLLLSSELTHWLFLNHNIYYKAKAEALLRVITPELVHKVIDQGSCKGESCLLRLLQRTSALQWLFADEERVKAFLNNPVVINQVVEMGKAAGESCLFYLLYSLKTRNWLLGGSDNANEILDKMSLATINSVNSHRESCLFWLLRTRNGRSWLFGGSDKPNEILDKMSVDTINQVISNGKFAGESCLFWLLRTRNGLSWLFGGSDKANEILDKMSVDTINQVISNGEFAGESCLFWLLCTMGGCAWLFGGSDKANEILSKMSVDTVNQVISNGEFAGESCLFWLLRSKEGRSWLFAKRSFWSGLFTSHYEYTNPLLFRIFDVASTVINQVIPGSINTHYCGQSCLLWLLVTKEGQDFFHAARTSSVVRKVLEKIKSGVTEEVLSAVTNGQDPEMKNGEQCYAYLRKMNLSVEWRTVALVNKVNSMTDEDEVNDTETSVRFLNKVRAELSRREGVDDVRSLITPVRSRG